MISKSKSLITSVQGVHKELHIEGGKIFVEFQTYFKSRWARDAIITATHDMIHDLIYRKVFANDNIELCKTITVIEIGDSSLSEC